MPGWSTVGRKMSPSLLLGVMMTIGLVANVEGGMNATWIAPTIGCSGFGTPCYPFCQAAMPQMMCARESVCRDVYMKATLGQSLRFTLAATNPTPSGTIEATPHCNKFLTEQDFCAPVEIMVSAMQPNDAGKACCGGSQNLSMPMTLSPLTASAPGLTVMNNYPEYQNVTTVMFEWNIRDVADAGVDPIPLYNISFMASYGGLNNVSACRKNVFIRICNPPVFDVSPKIEPTALVGSPTVGMMMNPAEVDCDEVACLHTPGVMDESGATHVDIKMRGGSSDLMAGTTVTFNISAQTLNAGNTVELLVTEDPGLPIGMSVGPQFACGSKVCRTVTWTPGMSQVGMHMAYFVAKSVGPGDPAMAACGEVFSQPLIVRGLVMHPEAMWVSPMTHVAEDIVVGTTYTTHLVCKSNYEPAVRLVGSEGLMGASWEHMGVEEEAGTGMFIATYKFEYLPQRGEEGGMKHWSFTCGDDQGIMASETRTLSLNTRLCVYTVMAHDTLQTITRRYHLSTNWLNVWNANPTMVLDPDLDIGAGKQIKVGPVYEIQAGDTLANVAAQFSTTVKKLLSVNPHLMEAPEMEIMPGAHMCILACTNQPAPSMSYKWAY